MPQDTRVVTSFPKHEVPFLGPSEKSGVAMASPAPQVLTALDTDRVLLSEKDIKLSCDPFEYLQNLY